MKKFVFALMLTIPMALTVAVLAQSPQETSPTVPALDSFHEVIMPMWHTAYPAKDYAALRKLAPEVEAGVAKIAAAKLPGILREKEAAWGKGIESLKSAGAAYTKAAAGKDDAALLAAAETLHTVYEKQVQVIRPVVKEMNDFHQVLYVVQHTHVPAKNWDAVCKVSGEFETKAAAIAKATLPKRVEAKASQFKASADSLVADAKALTAACATKQAAAIEKATETLHSRYEGLGTIFE